MAQQLIYDVRDRHAIGLTKAKAPPAVDLAPADAVKVVAGGARAERHARCWAAAWARRAVHVAYEDLLRDHDSVQRELAALLGLADYAPTTKTRSAAAWAEGLRARERPCRLRVADYGAVADALAAAGLHGCDECKAGGSF